jgi:hypothetical protein
MFIHLQTYMYSKAQEAAMRQARGEAGPMDRVAAVLTPLSAALSRVQMFLETMLLPPDRAGSKPIPRHRAVVHVKDRKNGGD